MATITATKAGNWSDTSVWDLGRIPAADDDVALAGYVIVWDTAVTRIPATGTLTSISSTGTAGQITLALDDAAFHSGAGLYVTTMTAGTKASAGILTISGTTDHALTIVVGTGAGEGIIGGTSNASYCVSTSTAVTVNITGNVTGGSSTSCHGVYAAGGPTVSVTGSCTGGSGNSAAGVFFNTTGAFTQTGGNITGGGNINSYGLRCNYNTASVSGVITGGTGINSIGIANDGRGKVTLSATSTLIYGTNASPISGTSPAWQPASTSYVKMYVGALFGQAANTEFPQVLTAGNIKSGVVSGSVTGTLASGGGFPILGGSVVR